MATFNKHYLTSELLELLKRCSLIHYYWTYNNGLYTFYFVDNRRLPRLKANGYYHISCHKSNFYRLRNKINFLPFRLDFLRKSANLYSFYLVPDSLSLNDGSLDKLNELNEQFDGKRIVNVVVI